MNALDAIFTRTSAPRLSKPAPDKSTLRNIFRAAFRAADHGLLQPWRFLIIEGDSRSKLGELFLAAHLESDPDISVEKQASIRKKPFRAPLIIVTISSHKKHPKVPSIEQDLSAAAATQNMLIAAHAQGIGAMWRTGSMAYHPAVIAGLGLSEREKIIGFLYLGTNTGPIRSIAEPDVDTFFREW